MNIQDRVFLVIGMARSGIAAAQTLTALGARVIVNDTKTREELFPAIEEIADLPVTWRLGQTPELSVDEADVIIISPGVPIGASFIAHAQALGKEVIGEIELASRLNQAPIVAITGTNGKTTTTTLTGEIFATSGKKTYVVGNIGVPFIGIATKTQPGDIVVAEISSFQMESVVHFRPHIAAMLNITEDHLNRHATMDCYIRTKMRVFAQQDASDFAVLNYDDPVVRAMADEMKGRVVFFSRKAVLGEGMCVRDGHMIWRFAGQETPVLPANEVYIPGAHNLENALCAAAMALLSGVAPDIVAQALRSFRGVEHRLEQVCDIRGIRFINDSKGTNVDASIKAVEAMGRPTVLILGGYDKHTDFMPLFQAFTPQIVHIVVIGETAAQLMRTAKETGFTRAVMAPDFKSAVEKAFSLAQDGGNVLLSPACASFDMFVDYEERGRVFKEIVRRLEKQYGQE